MSPTHRLTYTVTDLPSQIKQSNQLSLRSRQTHDAPSRPHPNPNLTTTHILVIDHPILLFPRSRQVRTRESCSVAARGYDCRRSHEVTLLSDRKREGLSVVGCLRGSKEGGMRITPSTRGCPRSRVGEKCGSKKRSFDCCGLFTQWLIEMRFVEFDGLIV